MLNRIRELRKNLKMTQSEFGNKIGVKGNTITNYETGLRNPSEAVIFSICREFNVNEEWLRNGVGEMFIHRTRTEKITDFAADVLKDEEESFRRRLVEALADLEIEEWDLLEKIAEKAVKKREKKLG